MTFVLDLPADLEQRLQQEAQRRGLSKDQVTLRLLDENLPATNQSSAVGALLQSWIDENDGGEQKETGDYLVRALDEDRVSERRLFPPELEGVTW
jgi:hypothetical protein